MSEATALERSPDSTSISRHCLPRHESFYFRRPRNFVERRRIALFAGTELLRMGDQVAVEFTPPFSLPPIRVEAKVCNRAGYHYGVDFLAIDTVQRQCVDQLRMHLASFCHHLLNRLVRAGNSKPGAVSPATLAGLGWSAGRCERIVESRVSPAWRPPLPA